VAYAGLAVSATLADFGRNGPRRQLLRLTALVVSAHVLLVWAVRYHWQVEAATRNGLVPFLVFHTALVLIIVAALVARPWTRTLVWIAFPIVSLGAIGAVLTHDAVTHYRLPVIALAAFGFTGMGRQVLRRPTRPFA
jgi:hypothetical protein